MRTGGNKMKRIVVIILLLAMSACSNTHKSQLDAGPIDTADGQLFSWTNPTTGVAGTIKPTRTFYAGEDIYCREFEARIAVNEAIGTTTSRACRIAGGAWYLAPNA